MSNENDKRQVPISYAKKGEFRLSEPVPVHTPRSIENSSADALPPTPMTQSSKPIYGEGQLILADAEGPQLAPSEDATTSTDVVLATSVPGDNDGPTAKGNGKSKGAKGGKPKVNIETLEQFIAYAFGRKGHWVKLNSQTERVISQNPRLEDDAVSRLLSLADADAQLAVLRQLLLISREVEGLPALRAAINGFVSTAMLRHPVFADPGVQATVRNLPDAPQVELAMKRVVGFKPPEAGEKDNLKPTELQALRQNAVHLMVTWLATSRGMNIEELSKLLFQAVWAPAASELVDDNARIRALTEIEQLAGVGLACEKFRQNVIDAGAACDQAQRQASAWRESVGELRSQLEQVTAERDALAAELEALKVSSAKDLADVRKRQEVERTHLQHGQEQLSGRLVRCLSDSIEMLEVGLTALRNKTPRTEVMAERVEHVIDALRAEESNLREN